MRQLEGFSSIWNYAGIDIDFTYFSHLEGNLFIFYDSNLQASQAYNC